MLRTLALALVLSPAVAFSQEAPPQAMPPPTYDYPAPQPPPQQPYYYYGAPQQPYCYPQQPCYPSQSQPYYAPTYAPRASADGWRTVVGDDGRWYQEREVKKGNPALVATGLIMWLGGWMGTAWGGTMADGAVGAVSFVPFIGPFISASLQGSDHMESAVGYTIGGLISVTGFVMFIAGAASKHTVHERRPISWGAAPTRDGFAANLSVRF
jgi:hypothetical protein